MKTIRQIADEIGVSKQAVYKRYKGKLHTVCAPYAHTEQGVLYLSEQAETLIKQDFLKDDRSNGAHTERSIGAVPEQSQEAGVVAVLQATIDMLQGQLAVNGSADRGTERKAGGGQLGAACCPADSGNGSGPPCRDYQTTAI